MANIYVKLGSKIKGESTDDAHADWCEANSISVSCTQPVSQQSGTGGRSASGVQFEDFEFEKYIDTATPDIMFFCCAGEHIDKIEVECTQAAGDKNAYLRYEFENCMISEISRSGDGEDRPTETVKINFGKIKEIYTPIDNTGKAGTKAERGWDLEKNVKV